MEFSSADVNSRLNDPTGKLQIFDSSSLVSNFSSFSFFLPTASFSFLVDVYFSRCELLFLFVVLLLSCPRRWSSSCIYTGLLLRLSDGIHVFRTSDKKLWTCLAVIDDASVWYILNRSMLDVYRKTPCRGQRSDYDSQQKVKLTTEEHRGYFSSFFNDLY